MASSGFCALGRPPGEYMRVCAIHFSSLTRHFLRWGSVLTLGSFSETLFDETMASSLGA
jgi:hypothetical protein